jgi:serine/threonine-protein kinase HipA
MKELVALLDNREVGVVVLDRNRLTFVYSDDWRSAPGAYPLSLSMPLAAKEHPHSAIEPFLWGLLPDNEFILGRWAQKFQVSARNPFAFLSHVGEDCAGAVQFVARERIGEFLTTPPAPTQWLGERDVADRLRSLRGDASAWRQPQDAGQFSLAGAQPKTALLFDGARWGVPSGRTPTTHILKPPVSGLDGHAENEHLCLATARALGMPTARSEVLRFDGETAIVIERYDRLLRGGDILRVHQEDFCQALRLHPSKKYQNDGGPGPKDIVDLLRSYSQPLISTEVKTAPMFPTNAFKAAQVLDRNIETFLDALIYNWLIAGTDAHAKNYSVLIGARGMILLAPLYDIASFLPYDDIDPRKAKLAMKIGDDYRLHYIGLSEWRKLAATLKIDPDALIERVRSMAQRLPDLVATEAQRANDEGLTHHIIGKLVDALAKRAKPIATA